MIDQNCFSQVQPAVLIVFHSLLYSLFSAYGTYKDIPARAFFNVQVSVIYSTVILQLKIEPVCHESSEKSTQISSPTRAFIACTHNVTKGRRLSSSQILGLLLSLATLDSCAKLHVYLKNDFANTCWVYSNTSKTGTTIYLNTR